MTDAVTASIPEVRGGAEDDEEHLPVAPTNEDDDETACGVSFFEEHAECSAILAEASAALPISWERVVPNNDPTVAALALFEKYLQRYQEYPQLIKHHLGALVEPLMAMIVARMPGSTTLAQLRGDTTLAEGEDGAAVPVSQMPEGYDEFDVDAPRTPLHHICRCLYVVVKVAGPKSCTSFFSHDVRMFEDVCYALMHWHSTPCLHREWEVRYCLILWLCNLILVPFAIHSIDSALSDDGIPLSQHLLRLSFEFLKDTSRCREAAALLIARLMSRADGAAHREEFFQNVQLWLEDKSLSGVQLDGVLQALATTLKLAKRRELLKYVPPLIPLVCVVAEERHMDSKLCKAALKVTQRLGLCLLKQQSAPWRYLKAVGSLEDNLLVSRSDSGCVAASPLDRATGAQDGDDEAEDAAAECEGEGLEEVIGLLIQSLSHPDTIVRWSAAKGIGRLCNRLPKAMADDVVDAFTEVFQVRENDSGWHGGMLALAELCRRSILLPSRFQATVETVARGLMYDVSRGTYSVGSHVRDAACYVCWSVARAYNAVDLEPYVHQLSTTLVIASLFDREVNVRRAASAALQECVGRLGNFPNGIDLVTTMDFFSLATMRGAYLSVAPQVGMYAAYWQSMVAALVDVKLVHWDKDVRRTAAKSLGLLAAQNPAHIVALVETQLLPRVKEVTLALRHGAIFGIAECVAGLPPSSWRTSTVAQIANIVPYLESSRQFRGRGGEYVRHACCRLLEAAAHIGLVLPEFVEIEKVSGEKGKARTMGKLQTFYEDCWKQILEWVQMEAVNSFRTFAAAYYTTFQEGFHNKVLAQMLDGCAEGGASMVRRGSILALGALPLPLLRASAPAPAPPPDGEQPHGAMYYHTALDVLCKAAVPEVNPEVRDAETRRNAIAALVQLTTSLPPQDAENLVTDVCWTKIVQALTNAFNDYAVDKRGDVGSYVRVQAMLSTVSLMHWVARTTAATSAACLRNNAKDLLTLIGLTLQQSTEKIDKVRGVGGQAMHDIMGDAPTVVLLKAAAKDVASSESSLDCQAEIQLLYEMFVGSNIADWSSPTEVFPLVVPQLLRTHLFAEYVMEGLVVSVGGLSVHVLRPSFDALADAFQTARTSTHGVGQLSFLLVKVAAKHVHDERFVVPLCVTVDRLINAGLFDPAHLIDLVDIVVSETKHFSTDIQKLLPLVGVLGTLCRAPVAEARTAAWMHALQMIASRYPKVRAKMGTDFYTALLFLSSSMDDAAQGEGLPDADALQRAMNCIATTTWDDTNATAVRGARNELYPMLALSPPVKDGSGGMASKPTATSKGKNTSYSHLVHEAGY